MVAVKVIGKMDNTIDNTFESANRVYDKEGLCPTIPTCGGGGIQPKIIEETKCVGGLAEKKSNGGRQHYQQNRVYKGDVALAHPASLAGGSYKYLVKQATKKGYVECNVGGVADLSYPSSTKRRGRVQEGGDVCPAITTKTDRLCRLEDRWRIRRLTPRECWRLMGFSDEDFERAEKVCSNSQLYKQAGNSIVVTVLEAIFRQMF